MPVQHSQFDTEPSLTEVFADPIVQAIMAADRVTRAEMDDVISVAHGKLASRASARKTSCN